MKKLKLIAIIFATVIFTACGEKADEPTKDDWLNNLAVTWVDFPGEDMLWGDTEEILLPDFPGTTFRWTTSRVTAINSEGDSDLIISGLPVWNVHLRDLTGDGYPEFCSTVSVGSGMVDTRVIVYDYAAGREYLLADRMIYDYNLLLEDGKLTVTQTENGEDGAEIARGELKLVNGELTADGIIRPAPVDPEEVSPSEAPAPDEPSDETTEERTAENTLHEAYYNVVKFLYDYDSGLNSEIKYIAADMSGVIEDVRAELETDLREWTEALGFELLLDNHENLVAAGYIDKMPPEGNGEGFYEGILFSFSESVFENETLTVRSFKYRGPLGGVGATFTARFTDGEWIADEPEDIIMA